MRVTCLNLWFLTNVLISLIFCSIHVPNDGDHQQFGSRFSCLPILDRQFLPNTNNNAKFSQRNKVPWERHTNWKDFLADNLVMGIIHLWKWLMKTLKDKKERCCNTQLLGQTPGRGKGWTWSTTQSSQRAWETILSMTESQGFVECWLLTRWLRGDMENHSDPIPCHYTRGCNVVITKLGPNPATNPQPSKLSPDSNPSHKLRGVPREKHLHRWNGRPSWWGTSTLPTPSPDSLTADSIQPSLFPSHPLMASELLHVMAFRNHRLVGPPGRIGCGEGIRGGPTVSAGQPAAPGWRLCPGNLNLTILTGESFLTP